MAPNGDDLFGGMLDFDGDGKTDLFEEYMAYKMFEEVTKENDAFDDDADDDEANDGGSLYDGERFVGKEAYGSAGNGNCVFFADIPPAPGAPKRVTWGEYRRRLGEFAGACVSAIFAAIIFSVIPAIVVYAAISAYDPKNSASPLVVLLFAGGGIAVIIMILHAAFSIIGKMHRELQDSETAFLAAAPEEELEAMVRNQRRRTTWILILLAAVLIALIVIPAACASQTASGKEETRYYRRTERNVPVYENRQTTAPTAAPHATTKARGSGSKVWSFDYDVDDFSNPEDFYDWYRDDFVDLEEAEDYYDSHGGQ